MTNSDKSDLIYDRLLEWAIADYLQRLDRGESVDRSQFLEEYSHCSLGLRQYFEAVDQVEQMAGPRSGETPKMAQAAADQAASNGPQWRAGWEHKSVFPFQFGRYNVLRRLGGGGMGNVYLANDTRLTREVALKIPHLTGQDGSCDWLDRFLLEARTNIQHPNICTVYDTGIYDRQPYISMAYIKGQSLAALIDPDHLLPDVVVAALVRTVALAMDAAHEAGIVHRDMKPGNIMIDEKRKPFVVDFGLAYRFTKEGIRLTSDGRIVGTFAYMSPEQFEADPRRVTYSTDIYSLGVTFYEALTGTRPFLGNLPQLIPQICDRQPEPPSRRRPDVHERLDSICLRMLNKRPAIVSPR